MEPHMKVDLLKERRMEQVKTNDLTFVGVKISVNGEQYNGSWENDMPNGKGKL